MRDVAKLAWHELSWTGFVAGLEGYRDHFAAKSREDHAYFRLVDALQSRPLAARAEHSAELVLLLNTWACRLSSARAPAAIEQWLRTNGAALAEVESLTIVDPPVRDHVEELGALHDDLIRETRARGVHNMSDAAASKALHVLVPGLFVMWDKEIRRSAPEGYGAYLLEMNVLARRLVEQAPVASGDVEAYLQELLGYGKRKTLAKYLDEYNWFEAVGREQLGARAAVKPGDPTRRRSRRGRSRAAPG
jgi:hypothetical protein